ncbi:hypothetical protein FRB99_007091 [Tulasnella sp. 403]|nr:hypothetical protein FRB99_007091 [Tulasnella sp. 403]
MLAAVSHWSIWVLSLACLVNVVLGVDVEGSIVWNEVCPDIKTLHPTKVVLDGGRWKADVLRDGRFVLRDVDPGSYVFEVLARDHYFDQLRVDVTTAQPPKDGVPNTSAPAPTPTNLVVEVRPLPLGTPHNATPLPAPLPYPIKVAARQKKVYFEPKEDFSVLAMFRNNPVMLLMAGSAVMMFMMPKLLASMDPEDRKELLERQSKMMAVQNSMTNSLDVGGGLANLLGSGDAPQKPAGAAHAASPASKKGKGKKR